MKETTQQRYHDRIARVIAAILADPAAEHSVARLAAIAAMSPFHFHRIYRAMTGEGVAETVRRVRLARAARALGETEEAVINVALDAGYDSAQAFARAFRQFSGHSPSAFQNSWKTLADTDEPDPRVTLIELPSARALCLRHDGPLESLPQTYRRLVSQLSPALTLNMLSDRIGHSLGDPEGGDNFHYYAGILIGEGITDIPGLTTRHLPGGRYAAYRLVGSYGLITPAYRALFGTWLPRSGFELDDRPVLEFYRSPWSWGDRANCVTDLMIPIKE
jgi:AraC family transcriptional regulator